MKAQTSEQAPDSLPFDHPLHLAAARFLAEEAHLLDDRDYERWLSKLSPEIEYAVPVTITKTARGSAHGLAPADHFRDDFFSLRKRIERYSSNFAWAEDPPSRIRHLVTNVITFATERDDVIGARSAFLLFRSRGDLYAPDLICGERRDMFRREGGELRLFKRTVHLDESVLRTQNLSFLL